MLYLKVSDDDIDSIKKLGAKWDAEKEKWCISEGNNYFKFKKWFNVECANIICENLYLVETTALCWKCKKPTKIVCFASDKFYTTHYNNPSSCNTRLTLFFFLINCPKYLKKLIIENNYYYKYSRQFDKVYKHFNDGFYISNMCQTCKSVQGDNFLHLLDRPRQGFYKCINSKDLDLKLHKLINLPSAVELIANMHEDDITLHMETGRENLASIDTDKYILEQAYKDEIDITKYLK